MSAEDVCPGCGSRFVWVDVETDKSRDRVWMTPAGCTFGECYWKGPHNGDATPAPDPAVQAESTGGLSERLTVDEQGAVLSGRWDGSPVGVVAVVQHILADRLAAQAAVQAREVATCPLCKHDLHSIEGCEVTEGYDHLNGFHECGCPGDVGTWMDEHDREVAEATERAVKATQQAGREHRSARAVSVDGGVAWVCEGCGQPLAARGNPAGAWDEMLAHQADVARARLARAGSGDGRG